jgi:hypothetical protein
MSCSHDAIVREAQARADSSFARPKHAAIALLDTENGKARMAEAEKLSSEQMDEADRYATEMLRRLDDQLQVFTKNVRIALDSLETRPVEVGAER